MEGGCDVLVHINSQVSPVTPAYNRITGFCDHCDECGLEKEVVQVDWSNSFEVNKHKLEDILSEIESKYSGRKKGIFVSNDTNAACLLNIVMRKYGRLPDDIRIVGFDNSAASAEAIIPISTIGQQLDLIARSVMELLNAQIDAIHSGKAADRNIQHRIIPTVTIPRETT